jgi:hypothetical protein
VKRFFASAADDTAQNFFGDYVMASLLHEDTRYRRAGPAHSFVRRVAHAAFSGLVARNFSGGRTINWSNITGSAIGAAISNAYYPAVDRSASITASNFAQNVIGAGLGNLAPEFWPDFHHWLTPSPVPVPDQMNAQTSSRLLATRSDAAEDECNADMNVTVSESRTDRWQAGARNRWIESSPPCSATLAAGLFLASSCAAYRGLLPARRHHVASRAKLPGCERARYTAPSFVTTLLRAPSWFGTTGTWLSFPVT